ncbi:hypothetical protein R3W88_008705 [Solanum pinnatisectum]|uniref:Uncharacterized protein n=1 Tax=Solanum pinnatisectum TaxID=50273 RepID=A0AAV9MBI9_9SOLN|nr:hypothetical protein R3W88_008705 [Solanum pinnatisectum]
MQSKVEIERVGLVPMGSNPMEENFICQFTWLGIKLGEQASYNLWRTNFVFLFFCAWSPSLAIYKRMAILHC